MIGTSLDNDNRRKVHIVFSSKSLPYAEKCIITLLTNVLEPIELNLITDEVEDKNLITDSMKNMSIPSEHRWRIFDKSEADEVSEQEFKNYENIRIFREGHPCWRKITDPILFTQEGEEMIILDPDLLFPNQFVFEKTPEQELLLMWQLPNCLLPRESVIAAFDAPVQLADHTDIGVAQVRKPIDLEWLDWFIDKLGGKDIPRKMHVESIIWAAMAMKMGGGYLDPKYWRCWRYSQWKRVLLKLGVPGNRLILMENLNNVKCFHASGVSKWWVKETFEAEKILTNNKLDMLSSPMPYVEYTRSKYDFTQNMKGLLAKTGYYSFFKGQVNQ